jgi:hypothetical protein
MKAIHNIPPSSLLNAKKITLPSAGTLQCPHCAKDLTLIERRGGHIANCHLNPHRKNRWPCEQCNRVFSRKYNLLLHQRRAHVAGGSQVPPKPTSRAPITNRVSNLVVKFQANKIPIEEIYKLNSEQNIDANMIHARQITASITLTRKGRQIASTGLVAEILEKIAADLLDRRAVGGAGDSSTTTTPTTSTTTTPADTRRVYQLTIDSVSAMNYPISSGFQTSLDFHSVFESLAQTVQSLRAVAFAEDIVLTVFEKNIKIIAANGGVLLARHKSTEQAWLNRKRFAVDPAQTCTIIQRQLGLRFTCVPMAICLSVYPEARLYNKSTSVATSPWFTDMVRALQNIVDPDGTWTTDMPHLGAHVWNKMKRQLVVVELEGHTFSLMYAYPEQHKIRPYAGSVNRQGRLFILVNAQHAYALPKPRTVIPPTMICKRCSMLRARRATSKQFYCLNEQCTNETLRRCKMCETRRCWLQPTLSSKMQLCLECNYFARNQDCLKKHQATAINGGHCLNTHIRCKRCYRGYPRDNYDQQNHDQNICSMVKCGTCTQIMDISLKGEHTCYISQAVDKKQSPITIYLDTETFTSANGRVEVNCICYIVTCVRCADNYDEKSTSTRCCTTDGRRCRTMLGSTALKQFIEAVILCPTYAGALLIGHCMSRFDGQLLLEALVEHGVQIKSLQARGMKLMGVVVGPFSMKLKDSFLLFPTSLSKFCQAMEVEGEKGFCPILANSATALSRPSGRCPARRNFVVPKERQEEFEIFFTDRRSRAGYNFKRELVAYCVQDVRLLWMACENSEA